LLLLGLTDTFLPKRSFVTYFFVSLCLLWGWVGNRTPQAPSKPT